MNAKKITLSLLTIISLTSISSSSYAIDRCTTLFEFKNNFRNVSISIEPKLSISGNRGIYKERVTTKRSILLRPGERFTTKRQRLQRVDDGTTADFFLTRIITPGSYNVPIPQTRSSGLGPRNQEVMGLIKKNQLCRDGETITFNIRPQRDTPTNRERFYSKLITVTKLTTDSELTNKQNHILQHIFDIRPR